MAWCSLNLEILTAPTYRVGGHTSRLGCQAQSGGCRPVVERAEDADVDLDEVEQFFTGLRLWDGLT